MKGGCYPFSCLMSTSKLRLETGVKYTVSRLTVVVGASPRGRGWGGGGKNVPTLGAGMSPDSRISSDPTQSKTELGGRSGRAARTRLFGHLGLRLLECGAGFVGKCKCVHGIIKYKR